MDTVALHNVTVVVLLLVVNIVLCCTLYGNTDPRPSGKSLLCSWWWWTVHYAGSEPVPIAFEFLAKPAACLSVVKKKVSKKESGGFGFLATLLFAEHNKVKI